VGPLAGVSVVALDAVEAIPLPNASWSKMLVTAARVPGAVGSLGASIFTPGTILGSVRHETEEVAYVVRGSGELRTDDGVANTGNEDVMMVFGFPHPDYPPTDRR
jgi:quercetin dioxygenase-like cupin family protein